MKGLEIRYLFKGDLHLLTAMHIGGGRGTLSPSDSPVLRTPEGHPFIPGSSLKGVFRSTVEKLASSIGVRSCGLTENANCIGPQGDTAKAFNELRRSSDWSEEQLIKQLDGRLCETCLLFGSQFLASKIQFRDLYLSGSSEAIVQVRDGVAIDRDSEKATSKLKFDYEVVPATYAFGLEIEVIDPTPEQLGLACIGLSEYLSGFGQIGGFRSRGLGKCELRNLRIFELDLTKDKISRLRKYLEGRTPETKLTPVRNIEAFIAEQINSLLSAF